MEIDLERTKRAIAQFGAAVDEIRRAVRPGRAGVVRVNTDDRVIELPLTWAAAAFAALAVATILSSVPLRREREEEPLGIG
ncbi:MAG TPA: hypothetical protein VKV57_05240 [bacterium]|jgi:hypothetical protein|nr:hypothetical protein [bacterium]HLW59313.1 hypothetical protein [bacterium]